MILEVCANSLESALIAEKAGADRIELCSELGVGGVTPSYGLLQNVVEKLKIPIRVLIRPRSGHFIYSLFEIEVMKRDIAHCKTIGVEGIVLGVLKPDFSIHKEQLKELVALATPLKVTFHRAFDWVKGPKASLKTLERLGIDTVLTSGQSTAAVEGIDLLKQLQLASNRCTVMAGGGVRATHISKLKEIGLNAIHLSGTHFGQPISLDGKIPMNNTTHLQENRVAVTDAEVIRQIKEIAE